MNQCQDIGKHELFFKLDSILFARWDSSRHLVRTGRAQQLSNGNGTARAKRAPLLCPELEALPRRSPPALLHTSGMCTSKICHLTSALIYILQVQILE